MAGGGAIELGEEPRGQGVGGGEGHGEAAATGVPAAAEDGAGEVLAPAEHEAPGEGVAIGATDVEAMEVLEDGGGADEGAIVIGELRAEQGIALGHALGGVVLGAFAGEAAFPGHGEGIAQFA